MIETPAKANGGPGPSATVALVSVLGCLFIWAATTYNNYLLALSPISDSYLPTAALFVMLLLCAVVNPLLRRRWPRLAMGRRRLALVFAMLLMASVIPGQGLMKLLPYMLAQAPVEATGNQALSELHEKMGLPSGLFPGPMKYGADAPAGSYFIDQLPAGARIPWGAWISPLLLWGTFLAFTWLFMVGLAMIVYPQWRHNERLPFPLLTVYESQLEEPRHGTNLPPIFHTKGFWIGVGIVVFLYLLLGLRKYFPHRVAAIPLSWNITGALQGTPLEYVTNGFKQGRIYFVLLGIAFFMPTRISFSIWFFSLVYCVHQVLRIVYFPPHNWRGVQDQRTGAIFAIAVIVMWMSRTEWRRVFRAMFRREGDHDRSLAGWMFVTGILGALGWLLVMGVQLHWALFLVSLGFTISLVLARIVAETGMPYIRLEGAYPFGMLKLLPSGLFTLTTIFFTGMLSVLFHTCAKVNTTVMAAHALGLDDEPGRRRSRSPALVMMLVLVSGLVVCWALNLGLSYHHDAPLNGSPPVNQWGVKHMTYTHGGVKSLAEGTFHPPKTYNQVGHTLFGAGLCAVLEWACLHIPRWPLHPVGLLLAKTTFSDRALASVFLGWVLKMLILRYGGSQLYRRLGPFFIGLIMGEVIAGVFWAVASGTVASFGLPYEKIQVHPG